MKEQFINWEEDSKMKQIDKLYFNAALQLFENNNINEINSMMDPEICMSLEQRLDQLKNADTTYCWATIQKAKKAFANDEIDEATMQTIIKKQEKALVDIDKHPIIALNNPKNIASAANQIRAYANKYYPEYRLEKLTEGIKEHISYPRALTLTKELFTNVYEIEDVEISSKQLLHTLINVKRGLLHMNRQAQTMLALVGPQASGKSHFALDLYKAIHQDDWICETMKLSNLVDGRSVQELGTEGLIVIDEKSRFDRENANALKSLITSENYIYKPLYSNGVKAYKSAQIIVSSNSDMTDTFWVDNQSRRLSQISFKGIKMKLSDEELIEKLREIWMATPVEFPYDAIEFVKSENEALREGKDVEDPIFEELVSDDNRQTWLVSFSTKYKSVSDYMKLVHIVSRDKVRGWLNDERNFECHSIHNTKCYKPTQTFIDIVKEFEQD